MIFVSFKFCYASTQTAHPPPNYTSIFQCVPTGLPPCVCMHAYVCVCVRLFVCACVCVCVCVCSARTCLQHLPEDLGCVQPTPAVAVQINHHGDGSSLAVDRRRGH